MNWLGKLRCQKHNVHAKWHLVSCSVKDRKFYFLCKILDLLNSFAKSKFKKFSIFLSILTKLESLLSDFFKTQLFLTLRLVQWSIWTLQQSVSIAELFAQSVCVPLSFCFSVYVKFTDVVFQGSWRGPASWNSLDIREWHYWCVCHAWSKTTWCVPGVCLVYWNYSVTTCKYGWVHCVKIKHGSSDSRCKNLMDDVKQGKWKSQETKIRFQFLFPIFFIDDKITSAVSRCTNKGWPCYDVIKSHVNLLQLHKVKRGTVLTPRLTP